MESKEQEFRKSSTMESLYVVDAVGYLFRSYYAIRNMANPAGEATNALYGFIRSMDRIIKDFSPTHLVAVFDGEDNKRSRIAIYKEYKGHRTGMPEDLVHQLFWAQEYCKLAGIPMLSIEGIEADDVMGTIAKWAEKQGNTKTYLCSSDKDLAQLVGPQTFLINTFKDNLLIDEKKVEEIYGVRADQIVDYLAIMGDASDNIPGISGFGPKTAVRLLQEFGTLEELLQHPEKVSNKRWQIKLVEEKEQAIISKRLAEIQLDAPIERDPDFFALKTKNTEELKTFFQKMHFVSLLKEIGSEVKKPAEEVKAHYVIINEEALLKQKIREWENCKELAVDTETTELDPMRADLVGVGIATKGGEGYYIPCNGNIPKETVLSLLKPLLESKAIAFIGHNIKYDIHILNNQGIAIQNVGFDTMVASYLLNSNSNRHSLDQLALECFSKTKTPISDLIGRGKKQLSMLDVSIAEVGPYCAEDVDYTMRLKELFAPKLKERKLDGLFHDIEIPLIFTLFRMENHGIHLNKEKLQKLSTTFGKKIATLQKEIFALSGETFNINSPKQLSEILYDKLEIPRDPKKKKSAYATGADVLEGLRKTHPIIDKILEYRALAKLCSTYVDALPKFINPKTNRIHCSFNQSVTATGRLSSNNPNLQNIPVRSDNGRLIREAFEPEKSGWSFISADYSQIELRILAHMSDDPALLQAFREDLDIHTDTAARIFHTTHDQVTKEMRTRAKAVNFGILYGQGAFGLSQILGIPQKKAKSFIEEYFTQYPKVKTFIEKCKEQAAENGYSLTLMNRQRLVPEITSRNHMLKSAAERIAVNAPIQGSQSDLMKLAMIKLDKLLVEANLHAFSTLQIHDEVILECPDEEIENCEKIILDAMQDIVPLRVPLKVDISVGKNWKEC